jgi:hypothetical protein
MGKGLVNLMKCLCALVTIFFLTSCSGGGSSGTGTLQVDLTDASTDAYQAIYVTINEVQVHPSRANGGESSWQTIANPEKTYNLLELVNGVRATLTITELASGSYSQLRLILGKTKTVDNNILGNPHPYANYLIDDSDNEIELKVPSGLQTGIKIVGGFFIESSDSTDLILDFNAAKSVVLPGNNGKWLLKPTIKILETVENSVTGMMDNGITVQEGVLVGAQTYNPAATDIKDVVTIETASVTDANGSYTLYLPPGTYNIVAANELFAPACTEVVATDYMEYNAHFTLEELTTANSGNVHGNVNGLNTTEDSATLSFRQMIDCGNGDVEIEVLAINVAEGGAFNVTLPVGTYHLVASSDGELTQEITVEVFSLDSLPEGTPQDVTF